jgi:hypothetical protein
VSDSPELSFELLHLISAVSNRIDTAFRKCGLSVSQMYTLMYLHANGREFRRNQKIVQRDRFTKILKKTFRHSKDQVSDSLIELREAGLIDDFTIPRAEMKAHFGLGGRTRVLAINNKGAKKVKEFGAELRKLHLELKQPNSSLLCPPESKHPGDLGKGIIAFLAAQDLSREVEGDSL